MGERESGDVPNSRADDAKMRKPNGERLLQYAGPVGRPKKGASMSAKVREKGNVQYQSGRFRFTALKDQVHFFLFKRMATSHVTRSPGVNGAVPLLSERIKQNRFSGKSGCDRKQYRSRQSFTVAWRIVPPSWRDRARRVVSSESCSDLYGGEYGGSSLIGCVEPGVGSMGGGKSLSSPDRMLPDLVFTSPCVLQACCR